MRKAVLRLIAVCVSVPVLFAAGCGNAAVPSAAAGTAAASPPAVPVETPAAVTAAEKTAGRSVSREELRQTKVSGHFTFHCLADDRSGAVFIDALPESFLKDTARINDDLNVPAETMIDVYLWPSIDDFHVAIGWPDAPAWVRGTVGNHSIDTVSPRALGGLSIERVILHEYTHLLVASMCRGPIPRWLSEGVASYEGREMAPEVVRARVTQRLPTLDELNDQSKDFEQMGGYQCSYTVVEFIVKDYGYDGLIRFIEDPDGYQGIFRLDQAGFEGKWVEFVEKAYRRK